VESLLRWLGRWWPSLLWAAAISLFSTYLFSSDRTGRFIIPILHWLLPRASPATLAEIHHLIRKCGHFAEYFILGWLILRSFRVGQAQLRFAWIVWTILIVACYASLDEFHQSFVPGRTPAVRDVLIDTAGVIAAQIFAAFITLGIRRKQADVAS
jgi:VanZ family protein